MLRKRPIFSVCVLLCVAVLGLTAASADERRAPSPAQGAFAQKVSDLMLNELVAALFQEFDETTSANVAHGRQAISLIFNDVNRDMRLIGTLAPLLGGANDYPSDRFEHDALRQALKGEAIADVQKVNDTWYYRRSVPLTNTMHANCVLCHANFTAERFGPDNPGQWTG